MPTRFQVTVPYHNKIQHSFKTHHSSKEWCPAPNQQYWGKLVEICPLHSGEDDRMARKRKKTIYNCIPHVQTEENLLMIRGELED